MTGAATGRGFSLTRAVGARIDVSRGQQFGQSYHARPCVAELPHADRIALGRMLNPVLKTIAEENADFVERTDRKLISAMLAAGLAGLCLGWLMMGSFAIGLALMAGAAASALLILFGEARIGPSGTARNRILEVLARHLMDFTVDPDPPMTRESLNALGLFSHVRKLDVDLRLTGRRKGRDVVISRIGLMFGQDHNYTEKQGDGLTFEMIEVEMPETGTTQTSARIIPTDAPKQAQTMPHSAHGLEKRATGVAAFDARYTLWGDAFTLPPDAEQHVSSLEALARSAAHGLTEVEAGKGLRPWFVIVPRRLIVLLPISKFDGAFQPPPFWTPIDNDALIAGYASDLAQLNATLTATLALVEGMTK